LLRTQKEKKKGGLSLFGNERAAEGEKTKKERKKKKKRKRTLEARVSAGHQIDFGDGGGLGFLGFASCHFRKILERRKKRGRGVVI
jgi:hypothetical protein